MMGKAPPTLGTNARSTRAHATATLAATAATGAHAATTATAPCSRTLSAASSLVFHLILLVGRFLPGRSLFVIVTATAAPIMTMSTVVEAVVVA